MEGGGDSEHHSGSGTGISSDSGALALGCFLAGVVR